MSGSYEDLSRQAQAVAATLTVRLHDEGKECLSCRPDGSCEQRQWAAQRLLDLQSKVGDDRP